jgi:EAL domain-containing protein (putative c-di-GMP-specific phosphodiesterase class I)
MNTSKVYQKNHDDLNRLKKGISQNSITPFFQPIITNSNGAIEKYECLVRLLDNNKVISPFNFLELSKRSKLYPQITKCVIDKSFSHFDKRNEEFSINICLDDILNPETTNYIFDKIDQYNNGNRIVFELLESEQFEDRKEVLEFINQVKKRGCKIAIDDFGTGYSNFDYILRIQADYLKIDASLIKKINTDINSQIITETIVNFSQKLNIKTIAEFVHNEDVYRKVKMMGIDYSQGFHLGEPSPVT